MKDFALSQLFKIIELSWIANPGLRRPWMLKMDQVTFFGNNEDEVLEQGHQYLQDMKDKRK